MTPDEFQSSLGAFMIVAILGAVGGLGTLYYRHQFMKSLFSGLDRDQVSFTKDRFLKIGIIPKILIAIIAIAFSMFGGFIIGMIENFSIDYLDERQTWVWVASIFGWWFILYHFYERFKLWKLHDYEVAEAAKEQQAASAAKAGGQRNRGQSESNDFGGNTANDGFGFDAGRFGAKPPPPQPDENAPRGYDKRHPDDAKFWAHVDDPSNPSHVRKAWFDKIMKREEARRKGQNPDNVAGLIGKG